MPNLSFKVAYPTIIAGFFIIVAFISLNYTTLDANFYIILFLLVIYIVLFSLATGHNFTLPVKKLLKEAGQLCKGDVKSRFNSESKDELGELAKVFNKIAEKFEESKSKIETLEESINIKAQTRILLLEEIVIALEKKVKNRTFELQKVAEDSEKLEERLKLKDMEVMGLKNQMAELEKRFSKNKTKKVIRPLQNKDSYEN